MREREKRERTTSRHRDTLPTTEKMIYIQPACELEKKRRREREKNVYIYIYIYIHYLSQHLTVHCVKKQRKREKEHKEISTHIRQVIPRVDNPFFFPILFECSINFGQNKTINKNTFDRFVFINYS
jgi:hypothetical protein